MHGGRLHEGVYQIYVCICEDSMHMYMHVYVYAYSGGRLLPFMQEGVAFARATLGAHVLIIGSQ